MGGSFGLLLSLQLILFNPLMLIDPIHELTHTLDRLHSQRLSQVMVHGKPHFEGLIATSSKSPSISLNVSQYLSE